MSSTGAENIVRYMRENDIPLTRENYIEINYGDAPEEWTAELEVELPDLFRNGAHGARLRRRLVRSLTKAALTVLALGLGLGLWTPGAQASSCYSVRDYDKRLACLAQERGSPDGCLSIHDWDAREVCRAQARQEQRFKELEERR